MFLFKLGPSATPPPHVRICMIILKNGLIKNPGKSFVIFRVFLPILNINSLFVLVLIKNESSLGFSGFIDIS